MLHRYLTDAQLAVLVECRRSGLTNQETGDELLKRFGTKISPDGVRKAYNRYADVIEHVGDTDVWAKNAKDVERARRARSVAAKEARLALGAAVDSDDLLTRFKELLTAAPCPRVPAPKAPPAKKGRTEVTMEVTLSDLHFGKKTADFDSTVAERRLKQFVHVVQQEFARKQAHYNVERIVIAVLGDIIENETMHGIESARGVEFGNAEQSMLAIDLLLNEVLIPLYQLGVPIDVVAITGNHDRLDERKTYQSPGRFSFTWIIYQTLRMFTERLGMKTVTWTIPSGVYTTRDVYGDTILYEHSDHVAGRVFDKKALLAHMAKRSSQVNKVISGMRVGHYHEATCVDNGRVIGNGSLCGQDSYSDILGFSSVPSQTITYYVKTASRKTSFYYTFPVYLGA